LAPKNKPVVIKTLMSRLKADANNAEEAYQDLLKGIDRKPFPSLDGLRNVQRLLKTRNPKIGEVKTEDVIDARIMRKLDESGFIDRALRGARNESQIIDAGYRRFVVGGVRLSILVNLSLPTMRRGLQ
jgi:hypothetical protein